MILTRFTTPITGALVVIALCALSGCSSLSKDPKRPEGAVNLYLQALKQRDYDKVYDLLAPSLRKEITTIYANTKLMASLVRKHYPAAAQIPTLKAINASSVEKVKDGRAFFIKLMSQHSLPELSTWADYGTRVKQTSIKGDTAVVTTLKGDRFELVKVASGEWRLTYRADVFVRARKLTETNLARIKRNVAVLIRVKQ